jgi:predicted nucleotidyltransferase
MKATLPVAIPQHAIAAFCERNHMRKLSLFGSVLTDRFSENSDIDMLVEFDPGHVPGLFDLSGMELELSEMLGRKVDLRTPGELSRYFRENVIAGALPQYERPQNDAR